MINHRIIAAISVFALLACGGSSGSRSDAPMVFVDIPDNPELVRLEQEVAEGRARLAAMDVADARRPGLIMALAEQEELLIYGRADADETAQSDRRARQTFADEGPTGPDYSPVIALYQELVDHHPGSEHVPKALYELGELLAEAGRTDESQAAWWHLSDEFPYSDFAARGCCQLGDQAFVDQRLDEAERAYSCAVDGADPESALYGRYMLAWVALNLRDYDAAIEGFDTVRATGTGEWAEAADRDVLMALAQADGGIEMAIDRFADRPEHLGLLLSFLAGVLDPDFPALASYLLTTHAERAEAAQWCSDVDGYEAATGTSLSLDACQAD